MNIIIQDWAGNILYQGSYESDEVDRVLEANKCNCEALNDYSSDGVCLQCNDTGYWGDFEVFWEDDSNSENVYEYINY